MVTDLAKIIFGESLKIMSEKSAASRVKNQRRINLDGGIDKTIEKELNSINKEKDIIPNEN